MTELRLFSWHRLNLNRRWWLAECPSAFIAKMCEDYASEAPPSPVLQPSKLSPSTTSALQDTPFIPTACKWRSAVITPLWAQTCIKKIWGIRLNMLKHLKTARCLIKPMQEVEASGSQLPRHPTAPKVNLGIKPYPHKKEWAKFLPAPMSYLVTWAINYVWKRILQD